MVGQANDLLPDTGEQRRALGLALFRAGTPAGAKFTAPRWPKLRPRAVAAATAAAAGSRPPHSSTGTWMTRSDATSAAVTSWQTRRAQFQVVAAGHAALQHQRLEDAVRSVFEAAIGQWQTRLAIATGLLGRLNTLPESFTQRHLLQWDLGEAYRKLSLHAAELTSQGVDWPLPSAWAADEAAGGGSTSRLMPMRRPRRPSEARSPYWSMSQCGWWRPQSA